MIDISAIDENGLEDILSDPTEATKKIVAGLSGDIVVLGAGGKMGPTLAMMLKKASDNKKIYAVSRFSNKAVRSRIEQAQIETIEADLLDESHYRKLPDVENVFYLAGMKFGSTGNQPLTWAMNSYVPTLVAQHYKNSRIVAYSTGNVYPLFQTTGSGATEETAPEPVGEYAQSCLGRERMFEYFSQLYKTPVTLVRLNYANEPRYGIIVDLTSKIAAGRAECHRAGNDSDSYARRTNRREARQKTEIRLQGGSICPALGRIVCLQHVRTSADNARTDG